MSQMRISDSVFLNRDCIKGGRGTATSRIVETRILGMEFFPPTFSLSLPVSPILPGWRKHILDFMVCQYVFIPLFSPNVHHSKFSGESVAVGDSGYVPSLKWITFIKIQPGERPTSRIWEDDVRNKGKAESESNSSR